LVIDHQINFLAFIFIVRFSSISRYAASPASPFSKPKADEENDDEKDKKLPCATRTGTNSTFSPYTNVSITCDVVSIESFSYFRVRAFTNLFDKIVVIIQNIYG